ncbi:Uncharacterised protein [Mycobacteroides abscessus subsp. abscessus]|nr:Uncharacterised protein [Mycobacteroides abscessus subsp. abscessus]DAZ90260.1 TPA_asm: membrane protein [Mycobacterium phage prophiFSIL01-1]SIA06826.1 Uncharacterised protein [Mycobacteroides abscessus subsp. abscessus]SIA64804.1 Uncharacterised protein [Mycobacteroides abscessus subsp. abscessus]SIA69830.1 Uncharacterised protein [Mycobacteroides abscessus subsp. abscessus]
MKAALFGLGLVSIAGITAAITFVVITRFYSPGEKKDPRLVKGKYGW